MGIYCKKTFRNRPFESYGWGFRDSCLGLKRIITCAQKFTKREGKYPLLNIHGCLQLKQPSQNICSSICVSDFVGNITLKGYATNKQIAIYTLKLLHADWLSARGGRYHYFDGFVHTGTQNVLSELIPAHLEVLGTVTEKVETYINGKADLAQPGVVKATEAALAQHKATLNLMKKSEM